MMNDLLTLAWAVFSLPIVSFILFAAMQWMIGQAIIAVIVSFVLVFSVIQIEESERLS